MQYQYDSKDEDGAYNYVFGSAGLGSTHRANRQAFEKYRIIPRMLVDATVRDISVRKRPCYRVHYMAHDLC